MKKIKATSVAFQSDQGTFTLSNATISRKDEVDDEFNIKGDLGIKELLLFLLWQLQGKDGVSEEIKTAGIEHSLIIDKLVEKIWFEPKEGQALPTLHYELIDIHRMEITLGGKDGIIEAPGLSDPIGRNAFFKKMVKDVFESQPVASLLNICLNLYNQAEDAKRQKPRSKKADKKESPSNPYRIAGHFFDEQLKYTYPPDKSTAGQLSIFDSLSERTKTKIDIAGVSRETIVEGVPLTPSQNKLVISLCKLLARKSQTSDPTKGDYFAGSLPPRREDIVEYGDFKELAPRLLFTLHELTREYNGGNSPSGKEIANTKNILEELAKKKYLIGYQETTQLSEGKKRVQRLEDFMHLVKILKYTDVVTNSEGAEDSRTEQVLVSLNPIFRHKIDAKFIVVPGDLNRRTMIAYGSHNVSDATIRLRDYLLREKSSGRTKSELGLDRFYYMLCEKWMREGRRKKVAEYADKAIESNIALGLIERHEVLPSKTIDGKKVVFHLNKRFPEAAE